MKRDRLNQPLPCSQLSSPLVLFWIERSKNKNIVVYEATASAAAGCYDTILPYWLEIDPAYVAKNRLAGKKDDRSELNYIEKQIAYGVSTKPSTDPRNRFPVVSLVALPNIVAHLVTCSDNIPRLRMVIGGKLAYLRRVYVESSESWVGLPKVLYVELFGVDLTGVDVYERIVK
jgi:hypothetical protein